MNTTSAWTRGTMTPGNDDTFSNYSKVQKGFRILHPFFAGYVAQEMNRQYRNEWWQHVRSTLDDQMDNLPDDGDYSFLVDSLDIANCIRLLDRRWNDVFRAKLSKDYRTWAIELMGVRNKTSHIGGQDLNDDDTWRALDTMARLCQAFDDEGSEEIRKLLREARYGAAEGSTATFTNASRPDASTPRKTRTSGVLTQTIKGLPSWRDVIEPHPDVAQGRYMNAEFAADLAQVAKGKAALEYGDPVEFFGRTYVTEGMRNLLVQALRRVAGTGGDPVIQLKTAFGGGKTHSMLALYHMLGGRYPADKIPNLKPILEEAQVPQVPRVNVAVLVGTSQDPAKSRRPQMLQGITVNTLWGEMAAQLAISAARPELYEYVRAADKKGVSPGSEALQELFDACGPNLILMDELVAYARKLYGASGLPAGTFENFLTFVQEVTEASRASENTLVVASIPESAIEIGGDAGKQALEAIEHTFGRMEAVWKPVAANEGFEVVRRRLFLDCKDPEARDQVCAAFSRMYSDNPSDFPVEAREAEYKDRMTASYPIHPEFFDRLYEDWATLDKFQRTRGVLRLMAAVIHELWMDNDAGAMIMPSSIPMDVPVVRDELTRYLDEGWNAIVDKEVDGKSSVPYQKDKSVQRYGQKLVARRVARDIMLGSAPTNRNQSVRGIESSRIRLGTVQPGENVADFNDALAALQTSLAYLYSNPSGDRFWYDTRPTLRKTAEDRANQFASADVDYEIERRLKALRKKKGAFTSVHTCPASPADVEDKPGVSLVILRPECMYRYAGSDKGEAVQAAREILEFHNAGTPRLNRNMLAFVAPDADAMLPLRNAVRRYLAWQSIHEDRVVLNLDAAQNAETQNNLRRSNETVDLRLQEAYSCVLVPRIDRETNLKEIEWDAYSIRGGSENIVAKAAQKMSDNEALITAWGPKLLCMTLDQGLWGSDGTLQIKTLWEYLCKYCYLPRLADYSVLEKAILNGTDSNEYFGIAAGKTDGRFLDLRLGQSLPSIDRFEFLVKPDVASEQLEKERRDDRQTPPTPVDHGKPKIDVTTQETTNKQKTNKADPTRSGQEYFDKKRFFLSANLDDTRIFDQVNDLMANIIRYLPSTDGATVDIKLEVTAEAPDGIPQDVERTVSENCRTLKVDEFGFDV